MSKTKPFDIGHIKGFSLCFLKTNDGAITFINLSLDGIPFALGVNPTNIPNQDISILILIHKKI
jgi:hypothetical protein